MPRLPQQPPLLCTLHCTPLSVWDLASTGLFSDAEGARQGRSVYEILVRLFEAAYRGNRAPLPLYVHTGWLVDNVADVRRFVGERHERGGRPLGDALSGGMGAAVPRFCTPRHFGVYSSCC